MPERKIVQHLQQGFGLAQVPEFEGGLDGFRECFFQGIGAHPEFTPHIQSPLGRSQCARRVSFGAEDDRSANGVCGRFLDVVGGFGAGKDGHGPFGLFDVPSKQMDPRDGTEILKECGRA
jgi:hypothetical protein